MTASVKKRNENRKKMPENRIKRKFFLLSKKSFVGIFPVAANLF